jgi:hypothetical protein
MLEESYMLSGRIVCSVLLVVQTGNRVNDIVYDHGARIQRLKQRYKNIYIYIYIAYIFTYISLELYMYMRMYMCNCMNN